MKSLHRFLGSWSPAASISMPSLHPGPSICLHLGPFATSKAGNVPWLSIRPSHTSNSSKGFATVQPATSSDIELCWSKPPACAWLGGSLDPSHWRSPKEVALDKTRTQKITNWSHFSYTKCSTCKRILKCIGPTWAKLFNKRIPTKLFRNLVDTAECLFKVWRLHEIILNAHKRHIEWHSSLCLKCTVVVLAPLRFRIQPPSSSLWAAEARSDLGRQNIGGKPENGISQG